MFDMLGDGIFNSEDELWEIHRKVTLSILHHPNYKICLQETVLKKLEKALLPMLENFAKTGIEIDMQDILDRFTFDVFAKLILDDDPCNLSPGLPDIPCQCGFNDIEKAILQRHILPESCWRLQKWLNFGKERKLGKALEDIDQYIYLCMEKTKIFTTNHAGMLFNSMATFIEAYKTVGSSNNAKCPPITNKFLRDVFLTLVAAGKDTISANLTWFFFLVAKNPSVEANILQDLSLQPWHQIVGNMEEYSQNLVYLYSSSASQSTGKTQRSSLRC